MSRRQKLASGTKTFRFPDPRFNVKTFQVIYDSLFPDNPRAIRSLDIEDWDAFCSPWAHDRYLKGK